MANTVASGSRPASLEALLLEEGLVTKDNLREVRRSALRRRVRLVEALVDDHAVDEALLAETLSRRLGLARFVPGSPDEDAVREVSHDLATAHLVVPVHLDSESAQRTLRLAMVDPLDAIALEDIAHGSSCVIEPVVATLAQLRTALQRSYRGMITKMIPRQTEARMGSIEPTTQPHLQLPDESSIEIRVHALIQTLADRGLVTLAEIDERMRRLVNGEDS